MQTLDEMLRSNLLTQDQYLEVRAYLQNNSSPERIAAMPAHLWTALLNADVVLYPDDGPEPDYGEPELH